MTEHLSIGEHTLAYDLVGSGPLVVLAHGMGDTRHSYRFVVPALVAAGYRVANVDIRGCGDSSLGWERYGRTDIAEDLVALIRHLGGPAVIIGHSISGGAATIAAANAPEVIVGVIELAPFTRAQSFDVLGLIRVKRFRVGLMRLFGAVLSGRVTRWMAYLDHAVPVKPADWAVASARIEAKMREPGRIKVLQAMAKTSPADAGAQLPNVGCPVLVVEGDCDPDWADPRAEGHAIVGELRTGLGQVAVIDGAGHYPHVQNPDAVVALAVPFLAQVLANA